MTGLWLLTNSTVLLVTERLATDAGWSAIRVSLAMGIASVAQAIVMAITGHLSSYLGRRRLFVIWGTAAVLIAPAVWAMIIATTAFEQVIVLTAILQVITVSAYGPVSAYLSERFPTAVRSTGYGMAYSFSLILPALYPFYLPLIETLLGRTGSVMIMVALGGTLVVVGALLGPRLSSTDIDQDLDAVATASNPPSQKAAGSR